MVPLYLSISLIVLTVIELLGQMFRSATGSSQIMDLGMRSSGMEGATRAGWMLVGLFVLFFLMAMTIRLDNAAIVFAALVPVLFMSGPGRWITAGITGAVLAMWTHGFMDYFLAVLWPVPIYGPKFLVFF